MNSQLYFITLPILFIILAVTLANGLLGKEENSGTLETVLARPISRTRLITAKALSGISVVLIITAVTAATVVACALGTDLGISTGRLLLATFATGIFSAAFGAVTFMLLAANTLTRKMAVVVALVFSLGSYLITSLSSMVDWLEWPSKLLPYHYYDTGAILEGRVPLGFMLYTLGIFVVAAIVSVIGFRRRDIA
jgi:ABC-2 type transport system permease protein